MRQNISCQELDLIGHPNQAVFYKYLNKKFGRQHQYHQLFDNAGKAVTDNTIAANLFNEEFGKNFTPSVPFNTTTTTDGIGTIFNVTLLDTYQVLLTSSSSLPGPDHISEVILRKLAHVLALPVFILFQQSLSQGIFPTAWKAATVVPIYKG